MIISWIFLAILIALSAFFSSAETAMTTVNKIKVRTLADNGDKRARTLQKVHEQWPKMLSAILIGNNIVNIAAIPIKVRSYILRFLNIQPSKEEANIITPRTAEVTIMERSTHITSSNKIIGE